MSLLPTVLRAAAAGLACFPLDPGKKTPLTHNGRRMRWGGAATTDPALLEQWFTMAPEANYGIAAKPSNLLIVDCDMGRDETGQRQPLLPKFDVEGVDCGEDVLAQMTDLMGVPFPADTLTVRTPKGGAHYYFANGTGEQMTQSSLVKHWIDIRSNGGDEGGYVVGPGSVVNDREYTVLTRRPIAPAPPWLVALCRYREPAPQPPRPLDPGRQAGGKLEPLVNAFYASLGGNQSATLFWAACAAGKDGIDMRDAVSGFYESRPAPTRADEWTWADIESQVRSAYRHVGAA